MEDKSAVGKQKFVFLTVRLKVSVISMNMIWGMETGPVEMESTGH